MNEWLIHLNVAIKDVTEEQIKQLEDYAKKLFNDSAVITFYEEV